MTTGTTVSTVTTDADFDEFVALPLRTHPPDLYVPVLQPQLAAWWRGVGPHDSPIEFLVARDGTGRVVGRAITHADDRFDNKIGRRQQLFGLTEFRDQSVLAALMEVVANRARAAGRTWLYGPVALLPNQTGGVITSGFDQRGFVDSPWNPPHHPSAFDALGFQRCHMGQTWICDDFAALDPTTTFPVDNRPGDEVVVHRGNRRELANQLELLRGMLNASFAQLDYYTEISTAQLAAQTDGLAHLLDESLLLYATRRAQPVAFVLVVPDISRFLMATGGRLNLWDQVRLWFTRGRYRDEAILIIKGTVPRAQGQGLSNLLSRHLLANLQDGGYHTLRSTFVGLDNQASASQYLRMGGRPLHATTFYTRPV